MSLLIRYKRRGAANRGEAESTRVRLLQEAIVAANTREIAATKQAEACYDVSVNVCFDVSSERIVQVSPAEDRWIQGISYNRIQNNLYAYSIAVDPMQNSYFISQNGSVGATYFTIQKYDVNGVLSASFNETPFPDAPTWGYFDLNIVWDQFSSRLFVAELVRYNFGTKGSYLQF